MKTILKKLITAHILLFSINTYASVNVYTDSGTFNSAISGFSSSTLNFESSTALDLIANGGSLGGITFNYDDLESSGVFIQVRDDFSAYSGTNYLGTTFETMFKGGNSFSLSFEPANAIGLIFLTGFELNEGDISLTVINASGTTQALVSNQFESTLIDDSYVYFLGLLDNVNSFGSVNVASTFDSNDFNDFNVDDITTAVNPVPLPSSIWLLLSGLFLLRWKTTVTTARSISSNL